MKGISPLITTVLMIAFTIAIGGLLSIWLIGFPHTTTQSVGTQTSNATTCSNGNITFSSVSYCNSYLSGTISNIGSISLGNITIIVTFTNSTSTQTLYLLLQGSTVATSTSCCSNLTLSPSMLQTFNFTIGGSNYQTIRLVTNCTAATAPFDSSSVAKTC